MRKALILAGFAAALLLAVTSVSIAQNGATNGATWNDSRHDVTVFGKAITFATLTGVAPTPWFKANAHVHGVYVTVTGGPAGCTGRLQGSADLNTWFDLDAADETCTSNVVTFLVDKPALYVRWNLKTLTGGTSPTVTPSYVGF